MSSPRQGDDANRSYRSWDIGDGETSSSMQKYILEIVKLQGR